MMYDAKVKVNNLQFVMNMNNNWIRLFTIVSQYNNCSEFVNIVFSGIIMKCK